MNVHLRITEPVHRMFGVGTAEHVVEQAGVAGVHQLQMIPTKARDSMTGMKKNTVW